MLQRYNKHTFSEATHSINDSTGILASKHQWWILTKTENVSIENA